MSIVEDIIQQGSQGSVQDALSASFTPPLTFFHPPLTLPLPLPSFISFSSFFPSHLPGSLNCENDQVTLPRLAARN